MPNPGKIATNLITGVLGAGKTTAIQSLIDQKPADQRWAIVINEYGQVSIDDALLESPADVQIMELANGCVCCTMSHAFEPLLAQLIRRVRPDRIIIEPSGAGHPTRIIDLLRNDNFGKVIDLRCTICLVDPADFDNPRIADSALFQDQLQMSDAVVISWTDKRSAELIEACRQSISKLDPPKSAVYETAFGKLDLNWLDTTSVEGIQPVYHPEHTKLITQTRLIEQPIQENSDQEDPQISTIGVSIANGSSSKPRRFENSSDGHWACGWIFSPQAIFDREALLDEFEALGPILRLKGIFHCQDDWWSINRKGLESSVTPSSYRSDSRLEIIANQPMDWEKIERALQSCLKEVCG